MSSSLEIKIELENRFLSQIKLLEEMSVQNIANKDKSKYDDITNEVNILYSLINNIGIEHYARLLKYSKYTQNIIDNIKENLSKG